MDRSGGALTHSNFMGLTTAVCLGLGGLFCTLANTDGRFDEDEDVNLCKSLATSQLRAAPADD